jgi:predicted transcriptional regulator
VPYVPATSLKLPDDLERRIARLAASAGQTPHVFMLDALAREAERAELRQQFAADADESEREAMERGMTHPLDATFDYLGARLSGNRPRRPRASSWRAAK